MRSIFVIFILVLGNCASAQTENCNSFRTGKYFYTPPNGGEVTFKRTHKKQIERYNGEHQRFIFKINWIDECEYTLTLHNTRGVNRKIKKQIIGTVLHCVIIPAELGHYTMQIDGNNESDSETEKVTVYLK